MSEKRTTYPTAAVIAFKPLTGLGWEIISGIIAGSLTAQATDTPDDAATKDQTR